MSRKRKTVLVVLAVLPLVLTAAAQPILPDEVAVHFGVNGPDQWDGKEFLFVSAGVSTAAGLVCVGLSVLYERLRATNNNNWLVLDDCGGLNRTPFPLLVAVLLVMAVAQGVVVGFNVVSGAGAAAGASGAAAAGAATITSAFGEDGTARMANDGGRWISDALFVLVMLLLWATAACLLFKRVGAVGDGDANDRDRTVGSRRSAGDAVLRNRALGGLILFVSLIMASLWCAARFGVSA
ncbi:DUF1648 domain-containing protein [Gordonibacter sp. An230]|uniref:DUF1648 domain-containing protein n=1 Tax=Gordonibacter sp. An230 TaxID=1965592 RepID=UPI0013A61F79|nr:DUF1648 domain-containing protein [Gordonibacter sp. An230]